MYEDIQIRIEALVGNNIACQQLDYYDGSFFQGHLNHLEERASIRKDRISNFQNSQKISERRQLSHFKV